MYNTDIHAEQPTHAGRYNTFWDRLKPWDDNVLFNASPLSLFSPVKSLRSILSSKYGQGWGAVT